jgi:hypothetical protein
LLAFLANPPLRLIFNQLGFASSARANRPIRLAVQRSAASHSKVEWLRCCCEFRLAKVDEPHTDKEFVIPASGGKFAIDRFHLIQRLVVLGILDGLNS